MNSTGYMAPLQRETSNLLCELTAGTEMQYSKHRLNKYYISERNMNLILSEIPKVLKLR